jgi:hypothetical protein
LLTTSRMLANAMSSKAFTQSGFLRPSALPTQTLLRGSSRGGYSTSRVMGLGIGGGQAKSKGLGVGGPFAVTPKATSRKRL